MEKRSRGKGSRRILISFPLSSVDLFLQDLNCRRDSWLLTGRAGLNQSGWVYPAQAKPSIWAHFFRPETYSHRALAFLLCDPCISSAPFPSTGGLITKESISYGSYLDYHHCLFLACVQNGKDYFLWGSCPLFRILYLDHLMPSREEGLCSDLHLQFYTGVNKAKDV